MIIGSWLEVPGVLEAVSIRVAEIEWHVRVSIVDTVQLLTIHELLNVVLDNWVLGMSSMLSSSGISLNAVTKSKDILESSVLESVWVDIDEASVVGNSSFNEFGVWNRWWVDIQMSEWVLHSLTAVDVLESCNFLTALISVKFDHFPSEHNINTSLVALVKGDFVGIWEFIDFLIWGPELDSSVGCSSTLKFILSHERFVVKSPEIGTFSLIWELWRVANHISVSVVPAMIVVSDNSSLGIDHVAEDILRLVGSSHFWKTLNMGFRVVETWSKNETFISVFSSIGKDQLVFVWKVLDNLGTNISSSVWLNLSRNGLRFKLKWGNVVMRNTEISLWQNEFTLIANEGHLVWQIIGLQELGKSRSIGTTYKI